ncbi:MAG: PKD domain-containing protein [Bacteroidales bacterium]|nr:PKD domain-containing protein [Bacteroidales bacterium]
MKTLHYFILTLAMMVCGNIFAQKSQQELKHLMQERNEHYFTFELNGHDDLQAIAQAISVDRVDGKTVTAYANNNEFAHFEQFGYTITLQTPPSMLEKHVLWDGSNRAAYDWDQYPTYPAYEAMMYQFATDHPDKCEIINLGTLPSGRKILIAHINNGSGAGKPKFLYTSTIHGDETTGWMLMLRMIDYILENPTLPECANVLEKIDLYVGPNTNPDGTYHAGNNNVNGARRYNANGVDMNRNYPDPNGGLHPDGNAYAAETQWMMQFAQDNAFVMGANYHGGAEVMNYPWDNTYTLHADDAWWQFVSLEYANLCKSVNPNYMSDVEHSGVTNGAQWYMIGGGRQDYMNGYAQCREVTIECSSTKLPNASQMPSFWNINKEAIFAYMNQCLYGIHGTVTDASTGEPIEATITITEHDNEFSVVKSHLPAGDFHRPIKGGTYTVNIIADGYRPHQETITVADYETVNLNVALESGEGILPDFSASRTMVPLGGHVNFTDHSFGDIVSWQWTFEGAGSSTQQNPMNISYDMVGDFAVTLTVTDSNGNTETLTRDNYIHVREAYMMQNGTFETCNAFFYPSAYSGYHNNEDYTMTFKPDTEGGILEAVFTEFNTENNWDHLYIYDGTSTSATQIGHYTGTNSPGTITASNSEGALTFHFISDQNTTASGWKATLNCLNISDLDETETTPAVKVYPNPSKGSFTIEAEGTTGYQLFNSLGLVVLSGTCEGKTQINANLPQGIYFLRISGEISRMEKLVIEK